MNDIDPIDIVDLPPPPGVEDADNEPPQHDAVDGEQPRLLLLHDFQHYLDTHGLNNEASNSLSELNMREATERIQQEHEYQERVHEKIFGADNASSTTDGENNNGGNSVARRASFLDSLCRRETIDIRSKTAVLSNVPLYKLAESCDTVYAMAASRHLYHDDEGDHEEQSPAANNKLELSLLEYSHEAVTEFVTVATGHKSLVDVPSDCIVECCLIAHYVQNERVLNACVDILIESVDTHNCMSLCQLADQLQLPRLFERSLGHMMQSFQKIEEQDELWNDLSSELRDRIVMIKEAIQTSIHSRGCRLYFGSLTEYLAIFAENVQYYRERLEEAKERQSTQPSHTSGWLDAQRKIEHQERRVRTLETIMQNQKELFAARDEECRNYLARNNEKRQRLGFSPRRGD
jgi:hypothetical protein